jgi:hypothetical protein
VTPTRSFGLVLAVSFCFFTSSAHSQGETTSAIIGQVTDASDAAVPGATVTVKDPQIGIERSAKTDGQGSFTFSQLRPGTYSVAVQAEGFEPQQNDSVERLPDHLPWLLRALPVSKSQRPAFWRGHAVLHRRKQPLQRPATLGHQAHVSWPGGDGQLQLQQVHGHRFQRRTPSPSPRQVSYPPCRGTWRAITDSLGLLQRPYDLLFTKAASFHGASPLVVLYPEKLRSGWTNFRGAGQSQRRDCW